MNAIAEMQWRSPVLKNFLFAERGLQISHFAFPGTDWHTLFYRCCDSSALWANSLPINSPPLC
jgi:hypothetical protein